MSLKRKKFHFMSILELAYVGCITQTDNYMIIKIVIVFFKLLHGINCLSTRISARAERLEKS